MSIVSESPHTDRRHSEKTEIEQKSFRDGLSVLSRAFWQYTEETGESDTKPYEGLM